jgi:hypothetical protein
MNKDNKNTELENTDKKLHISDVIDSEIKIVNSGIYGTFNNEFILKQVLCTENTNTNFPITVGNIYNVLDTVIEPDGEYIIKCDDGRRLVAPRRLFKDA